MTKDPLAITPSDSEETMSPTSRLHFGKIYPIEMNVKVRDIGMITPFDKTKFQQYSKQELYNDHASDDEDTAA